jgi:hypothetical protein
MKDLHVQQRFTPRIRGGGTPEGSIMKLSISVELADVIKHANTHFHGMNSF